MIVRASTDLENRDSRELSINFDFFQTFGNCPRVFENVL